ncbi:molybdenum cofactor guanylyltransferase [Geoglobus acetivorans]|uniref:Probable molybdenum cofactor guanylyltransferase n=1 Tax=Geoglobus acetivorans TaxID=565033 RepID=A0A0A7GFT2_GEOAI|nr:Molybdopterin-guanine dinucleotide biosynthesis protein MobA [Geoglobus acetivorans]
MNVAILVGGKGRRLGGAEKSQIRICGKKIIERLTEEFAEFETVIVCRDEGQKRLFEGHCCVVDSVRNFGPLAGIHSALKHFRRRTVVVACDMPFVKAKVLEKLYAEAEKCDADVLLPVWNDGRLEPLLAVYSPNIIHEIERSFEKNERKILAPVFRSNNVALYDIECLRKIDKNLISFFNVNTREDVERAEKLCLSTDLEERSRI